MEDNRKSLKIKEDKIGEIRVADDVVSREHPTPSRLMLIGDAGGGDGQSEHGRVFRDFPFVVSHSVEPKIDDGPLKEGKRFVLDGFFEPSEVG